MNKLTRILLTTGAVLAAGVLVTIAFAPHSVSGGDTEHGRQVTRPTPTSASAPLGAPQGAPQAPHSAPNPATAHGAVEAPGPNPFAPIEGENHLRQGRRLLAQRDYEAARIELERAVRQRPGAFDPPYLLGLTCRRLGDFDRAYSALVAARENGGRRDVRATINLARLYLDQEAFDEALAAASEALELAPEAADAWIQKGRAELGRNDGAAALASFERATELAPENPYAWNNLGYVWIQLGDYDNAHAALSQATALDGARGFMFNNLGTVLEKLGADSEAFAAFQRAAELDPSHPTAAASAERLASLVPETTVPGMTVAESGGEMATNP